MENAYLDACLNQLPIDGSAIAVEAFDKIPVISWGDT